MRVAYIKKDMRILRHLKGDSMTLSDRIERTMLLPVPRERVWDAVHETRAACPLVWGSE
ncbi:hypothetical protein KSZ_76930 [Dictyobacter formicarum]|uniref:Uncharacterized protein n=1 Tax=Dictyobacter formicarum TaxID=2778368 RepID=A0ABQ3VTS5_9CHLR|nr:hypothetical protein KSZ_76930 [Dictyobacter formicarum]